MATFAQNVGNINHQRNVAAALLLTGLEDPTPYIASPNHRYWKNRMLHFTAILGPLFEDDQDADAFWETVPDDASAQQVSSAVEAEIARRRNAGMA